jgi:WhiB family redox-sensing transcriptional regulator
MHSYRLDGKLPAGQIPAVADFAYPYHGDGLGDCPEPRQLVELVGYVTPAWHRDAACKEHPELSWFPGRGRDPRAVKRVCESCLVVDLCRAWALSQPEPLVGIWGGLTANERRKLRASPTAHSSTNTDCAPTRAAAGDG